MEEVVEVEEEQEDPEMAQALRDACFEAARIAANDSSERPTKTAFAIFKETSMKAAVPRQRPVIAREPTRRAPPLRRRRDPTHVPRAGRQDHGRPRAE